MKIKKYINLTYCIHWLICILPIILIFSRSIADIIVVIASINFLIIEINKKQFSWAKESWFKISLIIYLWFIFISFFAYNQEMAMSRGIAWIRFVVFALALKNLYLIDDIWRKRLLNSVLTVIFYLSVLMLAELSVEVQKIIKGNFNWSYIRLIGPFDNFNKAAIVLSLFFYPAMFGLFEKYKFSKKTFYLFLFCFLITLTCIVFSGHRSSSFIFLFSTLLFFIFLFFEHKKIFYKLVIPFSFITIFIILIYPEQFNRIFTSSYSVLKNYNKTSYYSASETAFKMFKHHPLTGVGLKNYHIACEFPEFISNEHKKYNITPWWGVNTERIKDLDIILDDSKHSQYVDIKPPTCYTHAHNFYIALLAETGIVGFVLFLTLIFQISKFFYLNKNKLKNTLSVGVVIVLIPLMTPMLPVSNFFSNWNGILIWLLIGWGFASINKKEVKKKLF